MLEMSSNIFPFIHQFSEKCTVLCILQVYLVRFSFYLTRTCALPPSCSCHCVYSSRCDLPGGNPPWPPRPVAHPQLGLELLLCLPWRAFTHYLLRPHAQCKWKKVRMCCASSVPALCGPRGGHGGSGDCAPSSPRGSHAAGVCIRGF